MPSLISGPLSPGSAPKSTRRSLVSVLVARSPSPRLHLTRLPAPGTEAAPMQPDSDLLSLLHPAERELIQELDTPGSDRLAQTIARIAAQLQTSRPPVAKTAYPGTVHTTGDKPPEPTPRRRAPEFSPLEKERVQEMADELDEIEKDSRRLPAVPSRQEIQKLLDTVERAARQDQRNARRDYLIIRLLYATGCRRSEVENLLVADLNTAEQRLFIRDGKGNKDRYVLIDPETARLLDEYTVSCRQACTPSVRSRLFALG